MTFLEKLKKLCKANNVAIARLERDMGLSRGAVYKWNEYSPHTETLIKLSKYFNVPIEYWAGDDVKTIAAHHDGEEWTLEELAEIEEFKKYVKSKRKKGQ